MTPLNFKISSGLKSIIGKELITDDFIAVFELVKNAFDAHAKEVKIIFKNFLPSKNGNPKIIIYDDGYGMNHDDLLNKWLFVAYSSKRDGTEYEDYRDKIESKRIFAGAKGIGRFSCDKLGSHLQLSSKKKEDNAVVESLYVDWDEFEEDSKREFNIIKVTHEEKSKIDFNLQSGTVLEITGVRNPESWDITKFEKLKRSLEKLINPNQDNDSKNFIIDILIEGIDDLAENSKTEQNLKFRFLEVSKKVENKIFETLGIKSTQIVSEISADGKYITTTLTDREKRIYTIKEHNYYKYYSLESKADKFLSGLQTQIFYLNRSAKASFTRLMGVEPVKYGSIFLYKNGFRIYPFGEAGEDILQIDRRKQQGFARFLGTREIIGRIEINGENIDLRESTSRSEGLIQNEAFERMCEFFTRKAFMRLEKYTVDVIEWGDERITKLNDKEITLPALQSEDVRNQIEDIIKNLTTTEGFIEIDYDDDFLSILEERQEDSVVKSLRNIVREAKKTGDEAKIREAEVLQKIVKKTKEDSDKAIKKAETEEKRADEAEKVVELAEKIIDKQTVKIRVEEDKNKYFLASRKHLNADADGLIHNIKIASPKIIATVDNLIAEQKAGTLTPERLLSDLYTIKFNAEKVLKSSELATLANFSQNNDAQTIEVTAYLRDYIRGSKFTHVINRENIKLTKEINPLELSLVIDNLEDNAKKWGASKMLIEIGTDEKGKYSLLFSDDGQGLIPKYVEEPEQIFELTVSATNGSGIGLYSVKQILSKMNANIKFVGNGISLIGAAFRITFN
jgi:signal transduction histidine kinase